MATALKISKKKLSQNEENQSVKSILINEYKIYEKPVSQYTNKTNEGINSLKIRFLEDKFLFLEQGVDALVVNSFETALRLVFSSLAGKDDNIANFNANSLDSGLLSKSGIKIRRVQGNSIESLQQLIDDRTKAIYIETLDEDLSIPDFQKISAVAKRNQIPLIANNTSALAGFFSTPLKNGAHLVINDLSKILTTSDSLTGAVIVESGKFDWNKGNSKKLSSDSNFKFVTHLRNKYIVNFRDAVTTDHALDLINDFDRIQNQSSKMAATTNQLAEWLIKTKPVISVIYPGRKGSKEYFSALKYFKNGFGNKLLFTIDGDGQDFEVFLFNLQRTKVILNNGKKANYNIQHNKEKLSIGVTINAGAFEEISEDFLYAFNELAKYKNLFRSRFLFQ